MSEKEQVVAEITPVILGNIRKLMAKKAIAGYGELLTQCGYSAEYGAVLEDPKKFNSTVKMLEDLSRGLGVSVKDLFDPDLRD